MGQAGEAVRGNRHAMHAHTTTTRRHTPPQHAGTQTHRQTHKHTPRQALELGKVVAAVDREPAICGRGHLDPIGEAGDGFDR